LHERVEDTAFAYFFCNRGEEDRRNPHFIIRSLVKQLANHSPKQLALLEREYNNREQDGFASGLPSFPKCQDLLIEMTSATSQTIIIIDALDECSLESRPLLLQMLGIVTKASSGRVKCFIASRNDDDIVLELEGIPNHYIKPTDNSADINRFVHAKIEDMIQGKKLLRGKVPDELKEFMLAKLTKGAKGM
jgi:hypothetical protein